jgi:hypothetical protein
VRDGELARGRRAAELVTDDRLAARRRLARERAHRRRVADRLQEQQVAVDVGIIEGRGANFADDRSTSLPIDTREANPTPFCLPRDIRAPIMVPECEATNRRPTGMSGSAKAALAVSIMPLRAD